MTKKPTKRTPPPVPKGQRAKPSPAPRKPGQMGAPPVYSEEIRAQFVDLISTGCVVKDACNLVGVSEAVYYQWLAARPDFLEAITRARGIANVNAVRSLRLAMNPHPVVETTTTTFTETRLRKAVDPKTGATYEQPYEYTRTEVKESRRTEHDWRAALEFLKRRDPDNWTERTMIKISPAEDLLLQEAGLDAQNAWRIFIEQMMAARSIPAESGSEGGS